MHIANSSRTMAIYTISGYLHDQITKNPCFREEIIIKLAQII